MAIALFTDFGSEGIYTGQMEAVFDTIAPDVRVISLLNNAPKTNPFLSAYLLCALCRQFPEKTVFLCVVDPGVGGNRRALVLKADNQYFVGPDNGLFNRVAKQAKNCRWFEIIYRPEYCSLSFHGRDIFAPVAAKIACQQSDGLLRPVVPPDCSAYPDDLKKIIYFDHYGNAMTGVRYHNRLKGLDLNIKQRTIAQASTFSEVKPGELFWYRNSLGLVEIAANQTSAQALLGLNLADDIEFQIA